MKIRNGFVSNSSSSSFLVLFPKEPKSVEDVKDIIFDKDQTTFFGPYDGSWSVEQVAETIWNSIKDQEKNNITEAKEQLNSGSIDDPDAPDYDDFSHIKDWQQRYEEYDKAQEKYAKKKMKEFFNLRKLKLKKLNNEEITDNVLYIFEFSDNDGSYFSALEHGDIFRKLKHIRISKH
jgi:hypothetical protein